MRGFHGIRVRLVVERTLCVRDLGCHYFVVSAVLGRLSELFERLIQEFVVVLGNVKFDLHVPNNFHTS